MIFVMCFFTLFSYLNNVTQLCLTLNAYKLSIFDKYIIDKLNIFVLIKGFGQSDFIALNALHKDNGKRLKFVDN